MQSMQNITNDKHDRILNSMILFRRREQIRGKDELASPSPSDLLAFLSSILG
jgi:hypothetical protein